MKLPRKSILVSIVVSLAGSSITSSFTDAVIVHLYPTNSTGLKLAPKKVFPSLSPIDKNNINQAAYIMRNKVEDLHLLDGDYNIAWFSQGSSFKEGKAYGFFAIIPKSPIPSVLLGKENLAYARYSIFGLLPKEKQDILDLTNAVGGGVTYDVPTRLTVEIKDKEGNRRFFDAIGALELTSRTWVEGIGTPVILSKDAMRKIRVSSSPQEVIRYRMKKIRPYGGLERGIVEKWQAMEKAPFRPFKALTPGR